jgi:hypothetical protein
MFWDGVSASSSKLRGLLSAGDIQGCIGAAVHGEGNVRIHALLVVAGLLLGACTTTQAISPRVEIIDHPPLATVSTAELGDTIVEKGRVSTFDGLVLSNQLTWGDGFVLKKFTIEPGRLRARQRDAKYEYYYSENMTVYDALLGTAPYAAGGLCTKIGDPNWVRAFIVSGRCGLKTKVDPIVSETRIIDVDQPNFRQELIYNGRSGETIKFLYREFSGDYARPPFSQDIQYDLNDGAVIGFKGVRIEILEASNTRIKYRVISSFPDLP